ncbi:MAG: hypothetical protein ACRD3V_09075 [Vicinamibacteria bacterium]
MAAGNPFCFHGWVRWVAQEKKKVMYGWGTLFLAIAAIEAIVGWTGLAGAATAISWLLCFLFLSVAVLSGRGAT